MPVDLIYFCSKILLPFFLFLFSVLTGVVLSCGEYDTLLHDREKNFSQKKMRGIIQESLEAQNICKKGVAHN